MFGKISRGFKAIKRITKPLLSGPTGKIIKAVPVVGSVAAAADLAITGGDILFGGSDSAAPAALPAVSSGTGMFGVSSSLAKRISMAKMQKRSLPVPPGGLPAQLKLPQNQLNMPNVLPLTQGRNIIRAPKGYVKVELNGQSFFMLKTLARAQKLWKPSKKPPISVTSWESLKRANRAVKQIKRAGKMAENVANFKMTTVRRSSCKPKC